MRINGPLDGRLGFGLYTLIFITPGDNIRKINLGEGSFYMMGNCLFVEPPRFVIEREIVPVLRAGGAVALGPINQIGETEIRLDSSSQGLIQSHFRQSLMPPYIRSYPEGDYLVIEIDPFNVQVA